MPSARLPVSVFDGIASLVEQSLLRPVSGTGGGPAAGSPRYQMLQTVREYGLEQLAANGEESETRRRHAAHMLALAEAAEAELLGSEQGSWLDRLESEHANLRTALAWAIDRDPETALRLVGALRQFWRIRGHLTEGRDALTRALAAVADAPAARAKALVAAAEVWYLQGDFATAAVWAGEARTLCEQLGDRRAAAAALRMIGHSLVGLGQEANPPDQARFAQADALFRNEIGLRRELGDQHDVALAVFDLGYLALIRDDASRAGGHFAEALPIFEASEDRRGAAFTRWNLAWVAMKQGDDDRAAELYGLALPVFRELGDREATTHVIEGVGWLAQRTGNAEIAARLLGAADALRAADGIRLALPHRAGHEPTIAATRATIGEEAFAAAWTAGAVLSVDAAVAEAIAAVETVTASRPADGEAIATVRLTPREHDVLKLIAEGLSDREIAAALSLSPRTVGWHVTHLLAKLGVPSRAAAVAFAHRHGLV